MQSHTGAIADESWVYDIVLRQAGVLTATDIDDMLDRAQLLAQLPTESWRPIDGVAVMASSGGVAGVAADAADISGVALSDTRRPGALGARARARRRQREPTRHDRLRDARSRAHARVVHRVRRRRRRRRARAVLVGGRGRRGLEPDAPRAAGECGDGGVGSAHRHAGRRHRDRRLDDASSADAASPSVVGSRPRIRALHAVDEVARAEPPTLQAGARPPMPASRPTWSRPTRARSCRSALAMELLAAGGPAGRAVRRCSDRVTTTTRRRGNSAIAWS